MKYRKSSFLDDIFVDSFAGGGGASTGIELATGHPVDIAINHDESAIAMHEMNHPFTEHYREDIWQVDPRTVCRGRHVRLAWFSPDCRHFSRAKGAALVDRNIRGLAWVVLRWAGTVRPDVILLENVPEFVTWGPVRRGKPVKSKSGATYQRWKHQLEALGYRIETRELCAADYGAPTIRKRFHLVARCDGKPIVFPEPTHAPRDSEAVRTGKLLPWASAASVIDWSLPCYSIFESKESIKAKYGANVVRPLKPNTLKRIARGLDKFVLKNAEPFIVGNAAPALIQYHTEQAETVRGQDCRGPIMTVDASNRYALMMPYLTQYFSTGQPHPVTEPFNTVTTRDRENLVFPYLAHFKGQDKGQNPAEPLMTITQQDGQFAEVQTVCEQYTGETLGHWYDVRKLLNEYCGYSLRENEVLLLVTNGTEYYIADIGLRMLTPRELYNAMGFPPDYIIDHDKTGKPISRADQVARCGNAVCPAVAKALVQANLLELSKCGIETMEKLEEVMTS